MLQILVINREVARKHTGCDLAAVGAVAHKNIEESRAFGGEGKLYCAAKASRGSFGVVAVTVICKAAEGEVWKVSRGLADRHIGLRKVWYDLDAREVVKG
jgi:hypothetical protein